MSTLTVGTKYIIKGKVSEGSFGTIYAGENISTNEKIAIKFEKVESKPQQLLFESKVYKMLNGAVGIPTLKWYGVEGDYNVLVMDLLQTSLDVLFHKCQNQFSLKTTLLIADQLLSRIEYIHSKGFLHRDIKPENFMIGTGKNSNVIYAIDFGLSKKYIDPKTGNHIPFKEGHNLVGTARFVSINTHLGYEQSRRDDLESIAYLLIYFMKGKLPWQGIEIEQRQTKYQLIGEKKQSIPSTVLCEGLPKEFQLFLEEVKALGFDQKPHYSHYRALFRELFIRMGFNYNYHFDWVQREQQQIPTSPKAAPRVLKEDLVIPKNIRHATAPTTAKPLLIINRTNERPTHSYGNLTSLSPSSSQTQQQPLTPPHIKHVGTSSGIMRMKGVPCAIRPTTSHALIKQNWGNLISNY